MWVMYGGVEGFGFIDVAIVGCDGIVFGYMICLVQVIEIGFDKRLVRQMKE